MTRLKKFKPEDMREVCFESFYGKALEHSVLRAALPESSETGQDMLFPPLFCGTPPASSASQTQELSCHLHVAIMTSQCISK